MEPAQDPLPKGTPPDNRPLSIALGCPGWPPPGFPNGISPYVAVIADEFRRDGHEVAILSERGESVPADGAIGLGPLGDPASTIGRLADGLVRRRSAYDAHRRRVVRSYLAGLEQVRGGRGPDIFETEEAFGYVGWIERASKFPIVTRLHGPWFLNAMDVPHDSAYETRVRDERRAIARAFAITAPSLDVIDRTRRFYGLELPGARAIPSTMPIPDDRVAWTPGSSASSEILFVGRFDRHKGGDVVIDAFAELARRRPGVRLRFVGPDRGLADESGRRWGVEEYAGDRLGDLGGEGRFAWMGAQPPGALPGLRARAAVVVVASRYEVFGLTLSEAMAMGCPVVASATGGIVEMIQDGTNGLLFEPGRPADLARKLDAILDDPGLAARLGARARSDARARYSPEVVAAELIRFYRETIGRHAGDARR